MKTTSCYTWIYPRNSIDFPVIFHTKSEYVKNLDGRSEEDRKEFLSANGDDIKFLFKDSIEVISDRDRYLECEIRELKRVLKIKRSLNSYPQIRYCERLFCLQNSTELHHPIHGNSSILGIHTIHILMAIFPTRFKINEKDGKKLVLFTRNVTKAFLQSNSSQRLVFYRPPLELLSLYLVQKEKMWRAKTQLYGDGEACVC